MKKTISVLLIISVIVISLFVLRECGSQIYLATENRNFEKIREKTKLNCDVIPLHCAIRDSNKTLFKELVDGGINLELEDNWGRSALYWAADYDIQYFTAELIMLGADINSKKTSGVPVIVSASGKGHLEIVRLLIYSDAKLNEINDWPGKSSALHRAVHSKNLELVELLLKNGADMTTRDIYGNTPLETAQKQNPIDSTEIIELLQQYQL